MNELNKKFLVHSDLAGDLPFDKDDCIYSSCYCEENVYKLCEKVKEECCDSMLDKCFAVFVSNDERRVPLWQQKAGSGPEKLVFWDYHVFLVLKNTDTSLVYDFDTCLTFPVSTDDYFSKTFKSDRFLENSRARFRVIEAAVYLQKFSSDRTHMLDKRTGHWMQPPPDYPPIISSESPNNLDDFISMNPNVGYGKVMTLSELVRFFVNPDSNSGK